MNEKTNGTTSEDMRHCIWRRIAVKGAVFAVWAAGMLALALQGDQELPQRAYLCMLFATLAAWAVSTVRDARRLRRMRDKKGGC